MKLGGAVKAEDWLEIKIVSMVSIYLYYIHTCRRVKGPSELLNSGWRVFSPGTPVSLLFGFSSGFEKTVCMSGARSSYVLDLMQVFLPLCGGKYIFITRTRRISKVRMFGLRVRFPEN